MPKPKENQQNKKGNVGGKRIAKRGPSSVTKKKDRLKRNLDLESSQLTISEAEQPEKVDEEKMRKEREEREEARRIWLQQQRIKYPVAPDGYIPNSIVRSILQPHVPHPPEKQPEEKTKLTFLERRMSRMDRMNSIDIQLQQQFESIASLQSSSTSMNAVDRDRPSSKKKQRSDVVNDVVTQIRQTSPQLSTSLLELEDIAEVESRFESTPHGISMHEREKEMDGERNGGDQMKHNRGGEEEEDGKREKMGLGGSGRDPHHDHPHSSSSSVAKQQTINDDHHQTKVNEEDNDSLDLNRRREEDEGLESDVERNKGLKEDGKKDAREDAENDEERDVVVKVGEDGEDGEKYPPSSWKIPLIVEPGDDGNDAEEEEEKTTREEGGEGGEGGQLENEEVDLTKGNDDAAVADHVTGSGSYGTTRSDENEKLSVEVEIESENGEGDQEGSKGQKVDSKENDENDEKEDEVVKIVNICLPFLRQLDDGDSAAGDATTNAANEDEEPEADESGDNSRRRRRRRRRMRGIDGEDWEQPLSPSYSFALRPPRLHDDDLDLTSFNSSMAATNASPPTFIEMDDSQTGAKDDGEINFLQSRNDFPFAMVDYNDDRERNDDELKQLMNGGDGHQHQHQQLRGDGGGGGVDENDRFWSSCSNGRLNRRHQHRDSMDDVLNPSPPLGWHLTWYDRHHQGQHHSGSSKVDRKGGGDADGFLPRLLQLTSSKDDGRRRRHRCEYSILVQKRMHEHISITRYLRTKKLAEILCDFRRPINANIIKFQYAV